MNHALIPLNNIRLQTCIIECNYLPKWAFCFPINRSTGYSSLLPTAKQVVSGMKGRFHVQAINYYSIIDDVPASYTKNLISQPLQKKKPPTEAIFQLYFIALLPKSASFPPLKVQTNCTCLQQRKITNTLLCIEMSVKRQQLAKQQRLYCFQVTSFWHVFDRVSNLAVTKCLWNMSFPIGSDVKTHTVRLDIADPYR